MSKSIKVKTKKELKKARKNGYKKIIVKGKLADNLKKSKKIVYAGTATIATLTAAIAAMPLTGGVSTIALVPIVALTGLEISTIIFTASIGIALILAIFKDYEEISYTKGKLVLKKKS